MRASSVFFVAVVGVAFAACGGKSQKNPTDRNGEPAPAEAGAGPSPDTPDADDGGMGGVGHEGIAGNAATGGLGGTSNRGGMAAGAPTDAGAGDGPPSRGGASSGGAPTLPVGGAPNEIELMEAPPGCRPVAQRAGEDDCNYDFSCEGGTHFAGCKRSRERIWECQCGTFSSPTKHFEVEGADGLEACGTAAQACVGEPPKGAATTCRLSESSIDNDTCSARQSCGPEWELGEGVTTRAVEHYRAQCETKLNAAGAPTDEFTCSCTGGELQGNSYEVSGPSVEYLCEPMAAFCSRQQPPAPSAPERCATDRESSRPDGCELVQSCGATSEIADEILIRSPTHRSIYCRPGDGTAHCDCTDGELSFRFDADFDASEPDACKDAIRMCSPNAPFERSGPIKCELTSQSADTRFCASELTCQQSVEIDGTAVTGYGSLAVTCDEQTQDGPWLCACASTERAVEFEIEPSADFAGACARATIRCQEDVEVFIGFSGAAPAKLP